MNASFLFEKLATAAGSSSVIGAAVSGMLGLAATGAGIIREGNGPWVVAGAAVAGALLANLPKIISARTAARLSDQKFLSETIHDLIQNLSKSDSDGQRIRVLEVEARHRIQGSYQAAVYHIDTLESFIQSHGLTPPQGVAILDVSKLLRDLDKAIIEIKTSNENRAQPRA